MGLGNRNGRAFWGAAVLTLALDFVTKRLAERHLAEHVPVSVVGDVVRFTLAYNPGAAFSMSLGSYSRYIFGAFACIALFVLWRLYRDTKAGDVLLPLGLGLAWGGAAGNLLDRFISPRGVVDFIDVGTTGWRFWTFNVADSGVTVGAIILAWYLSREDLGHGRRRAAPAAADTDAGADAPADSRRTGGAATGGA